MDHAPTLDCLAAPGQVFWITGLSGAGKTTLGRMLQHWLRGQGMSAVLLDGDALRETFANAHAFDRESRLALALSYGRLARLLADQGLTVIVSTISLRKEVHRWNRENIARYCEIYLDADEDTRKARDPKGFYAAAAAGRISEFAGLDQTYDLPAEPHIHLKPSLSETADETLERLLRALRLT